MLHILKQVLLFRYTAKPKIQVKQKKQILHGGTRKQTTSNKDKEVITDGNNKVITQTIVLPEVEGVIVLAEGGKDVNVKTNIIQAVSAVTGVSTYKVQVFQMEK